MKTLRALTLALLPLPAAMAATTELAQPATPSSTNISVPTTASELATG